MYEFLKLNLNWNSIPKKTEFFLFTNFSDESFSTIKPLSNTKILKKNKNNKIKCLNQTNYFRNKKYEAFFNYNKRINLNYPNPRWCCNRRAIVKNI